MRQPNLFLLTFVLTMIPTRVNSLSNRYRRHFNFRSLELHPKDPSVSLKIIKSNTENIDISKLAMAFNLRLANQRLSPAIPFMAIFLDDVKIIQIQIVPGSTQTLTSSEDQLTTMSIAPSAKYRNWQYYDFEMSYNSSSNSNELTDRVNLGNQYSLGDFSSNPQSIMIRFGTADSDPHATSQV